MSLFDKLKNKRSSLQEKKDDEIKKPTKKANKEVFDVTGKSAARDAKKYSSGEYPKIGGGERMSPKSKGPGASTGGTKIPPATVGGKNKGTTPVKVNITKPVKQSEVSKKAKQFTTKINKANVNRKEFPGDKSGAYKRVKTDIETKNLIKKAGGSGDIGFTAPNRKAKVAKRQMRADKLGLKDPFKVDTSKAAKEVAKTFGTKPVKGGLDIGKETTPSKSKGIKLTTPKDVKLPASFRDFDKKLKTYKADVEKISSKTPKKITKLYPAVKPPGVPQKGTIVKTPVKTPPTPSGTYSMVGTGKKEVVSRKKFVQSVLKSPEYVKAKESKPNPSKFIDQDTGKTFNMADPADKKKYLKQYGKDKFIKQTGGGAGGSGGGSGRRGGGFLPGGSGGSGGRNFKGMAKKFGGKLKNFAKANPLATALAVGAAGYYGYKGIKRAIDGPQLDPRKDFTKTGKIQYGSGSTRDDRDGKKVGDPVRFTYGRKETKNRAKPFLTPDTKKSDGSITKGSISKFRDKVYTVKDKSGKTIDVNKRIQNSAFTKQLRDASTSKKQSAKDFIKKYKKAAEYRGITT